MVFTDFNVEYKGVTMLHKVTLSKVVEPSINQGANGMS